MMIKRMRTVLCNGLLSVFCIAAVAIAFPLSLQAEEIGVTEKIGDTIPLDATFVDAEGESLTLGDFIDKPTVLLLGFYHCARACGLLTASLANAVNRIDEVPGKDFQVLSISFNKMETPHHAQTMKKNYLALVEKEYPDDFWKFLTGDKKNIDRLTEAVGYRFKKLKMHDFSHPNVLIMVGKDGTITRYLHVLEVFPFDIGMAIAEAKQGLLGVSVKKALSYCFDYDPQKKRFVFNFFRVIATCTIILLLAFYFLFLRKRRS